MNSGYAVFVNNFQVLCRIIILLLFMNCLFPQAQQLDSKNECSASNTNKTSYMRSSGLRIDDSSKITLVGITLNQCAKKCSQKYEGIDCRSFEYNALSQSCRLTSTEGQPFGTSFLIQTDEPGTAFFQQICIPTTQLCDGPYAFERFPQHVLIGSALEIKLTDGLSDCLRLCLEAKHMGIDCRSAMFFYETGECILNKDMRQEYPNLFTNDTQSHLVDYFENNCFDISCFGDTQVHWIRSESYRIGVEKDVIMAGVSPEDCEKACLENRVETETFPCRGYSYSSNNQECHLTAESALLTDYSIMEISGGNRLSLELSTISAGKYFEKYCLPGKIRCTEASFEYVPGRMLDVADKIIKTTNIGECFYECLFAGAQCDSMMYFREEDKCVLNKKSQFSYPELFKPSPNVDYYDNICEYVPAEIEKTKALIKSSESVANFDVKTSNGAKVLTVDRLNQAVNKSEVLVPLESASPDPLPSFQQSPTIFKEPQQPEKIKGTLETECKLDGIIMVARFETPTSGALFIKDHSATCRKIFESALQAQLEIPYPSSTLSNPDCPGVELAPALWSFIVVIQKNNIGIPSLMTGTDRVFNVTCDYSNVVQQKRQNTTLTTIQPQRDNMGEKIRMAIFRNEKSVTTVSLGEELELRWIYNSDATKNDDTQYGFFVEECIAERLDGLPPDPSPLPLVTKGCPDPKVRNRLMRYPIIKVADGFSTKMKVFRFDGSRRVRIRCSINICVETCSPAVCEISENGSNSVHSYGRKKRQTLDDLSHLLHEFDQSANSDVQQSHSDTVSVAPNKIMVTLDSDELKGSSQIIKQSTISGTYTIVDPDEKEMLEIQDKTHLSKLDEFPTIDVPKAMTNKCDFEFPFVSKEGRVCVVRTALISMLIALALLGSINLFVIINWVYSKFFKFSVASTISTLSSSKSGSSSTEFYAHFNDKNSIQHQEHNLKSFLSLASNSFKSSESGEDEQFYRTSQKKNGNFSQNRKKTRENEQTNIKEYKYIV